MDWTAVATYAGLLVGLAGLGYAAYERKQRSKLSDYVRGSNWMNFHRASNSSGTLQLALRLYKSKHNGQLDPNVLEQLSKADAFGQELFKEIIRQIQFAEPSFAKSDFDRWRQKGKLSDEKYDLFMKVAPDTGHVSGAKSTAE
jgi:hypothetical protein